MKLALELKLLLLLSSLKFKAFRIVMKVAVLLLPKSRDGLLTVFGGEVETEDLHFEALNADHVFEEVRVDQIMQAAVLKEPVGILRLSLTDQAEIYFWARQVAKRSYSVGNYDAQNTPDL